MKNIFLCILLITCFPVAGSLSEEQIPFPQPASLKNEIQFWKQVYTKISSIEGYIHDDQHLSVIYKTLKFPEDSSYRQQRRLIKKHVDTVKRVLAKLGRGQWANLKPEELRIKSLWPESTTAASFADASNSVRFQRGQADRFEAGLRREGQWRDYILQVFSRQGLPQALARLPHVESSFNAFARSYVGASGLWQFTRSTGRRFMRVDHVIDERLDPYAATRAAAKLLKHNFAVTGSWPLAVTAYNHGVAGMRRASEKLKTRDIAKIIREYQGRTFGFASRNFYVSFLAANEVSSHPHKYFKNYKPASPLKFTEIAMPDYLTPQTLADTLGITVDKIREDNPALQASVWQGNKYLPKGYKVKVFGQYDGGKLERKLSLIASNERFPEQKPDRYYKIRKGDSLSRIATRFKTSVTELMALNQLKSVHRIRAGKTLRLPVKGETDELIAMALSEEHKQESPTKTETAPVIVAKNESKPVEDVPELPVSLESNLVLIDREVIKPASLSADPSDYSVGEDLQITVQQNETLGHYADWLKTSAKRLRRLNHMRFGKAVIVGKKLKLSFKGVSIDEFEKLRTEYHRNLQAVYFSQHKLNGECQYHLQSGDTLWSLTTQKFKVPAWLVRQYNPDVNFNRILSTGMKLSIPLLEGGESLSKASHCV